MANESSPSYNETRDGDKFEAYKELYCHTSAIPARNRLRYLVENDFDLKYDLADFLEIDELATNLGRADADIEKVIADMCIPEDIMPKDMFGNHVLMPGMDIVIQEELQWREFYEGMEDVTIPMLAKYFGFSDTPIRKMIKGLGIEPKVLPNGDFRYPKELAYVVRAEVMMFPPMRSEKNMYQIMGELGCTQSWFVWQTKGDDNVDLMRTPRGHVSEGFSAETQDRVRVLHEARPRQIEGEAYTASGIANELGWDPKWAEEKLRAHHATKQIGVKAGGSPHVHYGGEALEDLRRQSQEQNEVPQITGNHILLEEMAMLAGTTEETAEPILKSLGIQPEPRMSIYNRKIVAAYKRSDVMRLARGIVDSRRQRLEGIVATISRFERGDQAELTPEDKRALRTARMQKALAVNRYNEAMEVYQGLREQSQGAA